MKIVMLSFLVFIVACTPKKRQPTGADRALQAYVAAVKQNHPKRAYALLDEALQKRVPYGRFVKKWKRNRKELLFQVEQMGKREPEVKLLYTLKSGEKISLVTQEGAWRVDGAPGLYPTPTSPEQLLELMVHAIDTMDFGLYVSLLSPAYRATVLKALKLKMQELSKARARLKKSGGKTLDTTYITLDIHGTKKILLRRVGYSWVVDSWEILSR